MSVSVGRRCWTLYLGLLAFSQRLQPLQDCWPLSVQTGPTQSFFFLNNNIYLFEIICECKYE